MIYLLITSLLWAFSFGLIKGGLSDLPSAAVAFMRLAIAFLVFLPFLRLKKIPGKTTAQLLFTGAIQYGLMYVTYIHAFHYLKAYEVALFTVFTPIYVTIINDLFERKLNRPALGAVALAVLGGVIIKYQQPDSAERLNLLIGFGLMQIANLSFAFGQIFYRRTMANIPKQTTDLHVFALLYLGATLTAAIATCGTDWRAMDLTLKQGSTLLYLGIVASGIGFFLWNHGARKTSTAILAVFNNLKIPLGILISILFFKESTDWIRLSAGGVLMVFALLVNPLKNKKQTNTK